MNRCFEQTLLEFGQRMGIDGLELDAQGHCELRSDAVPVHLQWLNSEEIQVLCYAPLGLLDTDGQQAVAWELLHAGLHLQPTGGASLSRDRETGQCLLSCLRDGAHISTSALENRVKVFVDTAEFWMQRLHEASTAAPSPSDGAQPSPLYASIQHRV